MKITNGDSEVLRLIAFICGAASLLAILPLPYSYYLSLRGLLFGGCILIGFLLKDIENKNWLYAIVGIAIIFNPLFPIHLTKLIWMPINLVTAIIFFKLSKIKHELD